jgi:hypothetical protein
MNPESFFVVLSKNAYIQKDSRCAPLAGMTFQAVVGCNKVDFNLNTKEGRFMVNLITKEEALILNFHG